MRRLMKRALTYRETLRVYAKNGPYDAGEAALRLPGDPAHLRAVERVLARLTRRPLKAVVLVGIGGSSLGTRAVYDALLGAYDTLTPHRLPKLVVLESVESKDLAAAASFLRATCRRSDDLLVNVITKSGTNTEPLANWKLLHTLLAKTYHDLNRRVVVTTDEHSPLARDARTRGIETLSLPSCVSGRFSVFSPVGLLPLAAVGIDVRALLRGARDELRCQLSPSLSSDHALASAAFLLLQRTHGNALHDTFLFHRALESLGKWYRQLLAESIGKNPEAAITPTLSIGSTDLHSIAQLNFARGRGMSTTFVSCKTSHDVMHTILRGTEAAYRKAGLPFTQMTFDRITPDEIGRFLQFKMLEVMYLGHLSRVNTFNQPHVEAYKQEVRRLIKQ